MGSEGGPAPVVGDTSEQDAARGSEGGLNTVVAEASGQDAAHASEEGEIGEGVGRTHTPPPTGSEWELDTPLDPPLRTYARRERVPEIERAVEELMHSTLTPIQEDLREARARLERSEREREILEVMVRTNTSPVGPAAGPERRTQSGGKAIQPREFSPKGNVGPAKWLFHMDLYFEYAHVYGNDRVHHGAILLRDAAESWWRSHVVATTDPQGAPTDGRLITWTDFATRLKAVFTPIPEKTQARRKLYDLRQVGSVQGYYLGVPRVVVRSRRPLSGRGQVALRAWPQAKGVGRNLSPLSKDVGGDHCSCRASRRGEAIGRPERTCTTNHPVEPRRSNRQHSVLRSPCTLTRCTDERDGRGRQPTCSCPCGTAGPTSRSRHGSGPTCTPPSTSCRTAASRQRTGYSARQTSPRGTLFSLHASRALGTRLPAGKRSSPVGVKRVPTGGSRIVGPTSPNEVVGPTSPTKLVGPTLLTDRTVSVGAAPPTNSNVSARVAAIGASEMAPMLARWAEDPWEYAGRLNGRPVRVMIDSGAAANFLSVKVAEEMGLPLLEPKANDVGFARMPNGARSECKATQVLDLQIGGHRERIAFNATTLEDHDVILGQAWLRVHNPTIDWRDGRAVIKRRYKEIVLLPNPGRGPGGQGSDRHPAQRYAVW